MPSTRIEPVEEPDSLAILIGVSEYTDAEFPGIPAARNSLDAIQRVLADPLLGAWPGRITTIADPVSRDALSLTVAELAEHTTGVLLLYYVGHGTLSPRGDLCLTVTTTRAAWPAITGVPWVDIADALRTSPARTRIAILDCCFAGQAIEALATTRTHTTVADIVHIEGVYTLTATTRNRTAHVPPVEQQTHARTSFTGELVDLITAGVPHGPETLTLGTIYPLLRHRLATKDLPLPNQRGTDLADQFVLTRNAWRPPVDAPGLAPDPDASQARANAFGGHLMDETPRVAPTTNATDDVPGKRTSPDGVPLSPFSPPKRGLPRRKVLAVAAVTAAVIAGSVIAILNMLPTGSAEAKGGVDGKCGPLVCVYTDHTARYVRDITVKSMDEQLGEMHTWWGKYDPEHQNTVRGYWTPKQKQTGSGAKLLCGEMLRDGKRVEAHCVDLDQ
ncbi:caspase domain-containing protein [Streptomyces sp. NPDC059118]|uniref:caspase family protein n=1 Tax=unclassified Streptomyces TaxID=2593676 RepID=UPI0036C91D1B